MAHNDSLPENVKTAVVSDAAETNSLLQDLVDASANTANSGIATAETLRKMKDFKMDDLTKSIISNAVETVIDTVVETTLNTWSYLPQSSLNFAMTVALNAAVNSAVSVISYTLEAAAAAAAADFPAPQVTTEPVSSTAVASTSVNDVVSNDVASTVSADAASNDISVDVPTNLTVDSGASGASVDVTADAVFETTVNSESPAEPTPETTVGLVTSESSVEPTSESTSAVDQKNFNDDSDDDEDIVISSNSDSDSDSDNKTEAEKSAKYINPMQEIVLQNISFISQIDEAKHKQADYKYFCKPFEAQSRKIYCELDDLKFRLRGIIVSKMYPLTCSIRHPILNRVQRKSIFEDDDSFRTKMRKMVTWEAEKLEECIPYWNKAIDEGKDIIQELIKTRDNHLRIIENLKKLAKNPKELTARYLGKRLSKKPKSFGDSKDKNVKHSREYYLKKSSQTQDKSLGATPESAAATGMPKSTAAAVASEQVDVCLSADHDDYEERDEIQDDFEIDSECESEDLATLDRSDPNIDLGSDQEFCYDSDYSDYGDEWEDEIIEGPLDTKEDLVVDQPNILAQGFDPYGTKIPDFKLSGEADFLNEIKYWVKSNVGKQIYLPDVNTKREDKDEPCYVSIIFIDKKHLFRRMAIEKFGEIQNYCLMPKERLYPMGYLRRMDKEIGRQIVLISEFGKVYMFKGKDLYYLAPDISTLFRFGFDLKEHEKRPLFSNVKFDDKTYIKY